MKTWISLISFVVVIASLPTSRADAATISNAQPPKLIGHRISQQVIAHQSHSTSGHTPECACITWRNLVPSLLRKTKPCPPRNCNCADTRHCASNTITKPRLSWNAQPCANGQRHDTRVG